MDRARKAPFRAFRATGSVASQCDNGRRGSAEDGPKPGCGNQIVTSSPTPTGGDGGMTRRPLPWSETCFVCGDANPRGICGRFEADELGHVHLVTTLDSSYEGFSGYVHGGVVTALLDETAGWACALAVGRFCVTARITVTFRQPLTGGQTITVVGEDLGAKVTLRRGRARLTDSAGTEIAVAEGLFSPMEQNLHLEVVSMLKMPGRAARPGDVSGR
jgi:uncharacterized protein (TIGR00369 family)